MDELHFLKEVINIFKNLDEKQEHGLRKKGKAIIDSLQNLDLNAGIKKFGKNIKMVNRYFIPVIVIRRRRKKLVLF